MSILIDYIIKKIMIGDKLEIVLITYNRYKDLDNTLKQFVSSPFSECKITILDNCSDDKTPEICEKYLNLYPKMNIIRHKKNIGGNANILRAVETSNSIYTWIICDDDSYDFSECKDIINAIDSEKFDLISPGSQGEQEWERGLSTSVKKLVEKGSNYFIARSFVPGIIFKTELFDSVCLVNGYANIHNLFPHFPFANKSLENDFTIYISQKNIITIGKHNPASYSGLIFITGWINSCSIIKNRKSRNNTIYSIKWDGRSLISKISSCIMWDKIIEEKKISYNILTLILAIISTFGVSKSILIVLPILFEAIIPKFIYKLFLRVYIYLNYNKKGKPMPTEWNRLFSKEKGIDPLREF